MIIIKNRELLIPETERYIGTTYDTESEIRQFAIQRFAQNGVDLSALTFRLDLKYANDETDTVLLGKEVNESNIILTWTVTSAVLQVPGTLFIQLRGVDDEVTVKWSSFHAAIYVERHLNTPGTYTGGLTEIEQMEQDHQYMLGVVNELKANIDYAHDAEAWAVGKRSGTDVPSTDEAYHNNSKYYKELSDGHRQTSERFAKGTVNGSAVSSGDGYHDNSKYYKELADDHRKTAEAYAKGTVNGTAVTSGQTGYQDNAKYYKEQVQSRLNQIDTNTSNIAVQTARIDQFTHLAEGSTTGDAELMDARVGANGVTYTSAGAAVRANDSLLKSHLEAIETVLNGDLVANLDYGNEPGFYVDGGTNIVKRDSTTHRCSVIPLSKNIVSISYDLSADVSNFVGHFGDASGKGIGALAYTAGHHEYAIPQNAEMVYLNFFNTGFTNGYFHFNLTPFLVDDDLTDIEQDISTLETTVNGNMEKITYVMTGSGYINSNGILNYTPGGTGNNQIMVINDLATYGLSVGDSVRIKVGASFPSAGCVALNDTAITGTTRSTNIIPWESENTVQDIIFTIPSGTVAMAIFNRKPNNATPQIWKITKSGLLQRVEALEKDTPNSDTKYYACVKKPFVFANKSIKFFGDSITYGYIAASGNIPSHQATNQYPKLFAEGVGATYSNEGVSGAVLVENHDTYYSIFTRIKATTLDSDYVFIAGGVNDWQTGVTEAELITGVTNICEYLQQNFTGEVIWITPINEAGRVPSVTPAQTLQNVRNVITRIALKYGYSVVQGWEFPYPEENDDPDYIALMFQDKIHPTELGYSMYAQALRSAVC